MVMVPRIAVVSCLGTIPFIYGVQHSDKLHAELLLSDPTETIRRFYDREVDMALVPSSAVPMLPECKVVTGYCLGGLEEYKQQLMASDDPYVEMWKEWCELPFPFAVWVAHPEVDTDLIEDFEYALTDGLEHSYEALVESGMFDDTVKAYTDYLAFDYIYDTQKTQALQKFWDAGLKVSPHANPG